VGGKCADGFVVVGGTCQPDHDASVGGSDGGVDPDGGPGTDGGPGGTDGGPRVDGGPGRDGGGSGGDGGTTGGGDGGTPGGGDGGGLVCTPPLHACEDGCVDLQTDPDNCGYCGNVCASGICSAGICQGIVAGHIVLIGHDYKTRH